MMADSVRQKGQRSCVSCREQFSKANLHRFVRLSDGTVEYDSGGRVPGRGAYVCSPTCLKDALKTNRLERALKTTLDREAKDGLEQGFESFFVSDRER